MRTTHILLHDVPGVGDALVVLLLVLQHPLLHVRLHQVVHLRNSVLKGQSTKGKVY